MKSKFLIFYLKNIKFIFIHINQKKEKTIIKSVNYPLKESLLYSQFLHFSSCILKSWRKDSACGSHWANTISIYEVFKSHRALLLDINSASCQIKCKVWLDYLKIRKWANVSFSRTNDQKFTYCVQEEMRCACYESVQYPRSLMWQGFCCTHSV